MRFLQNLRYALRGMRRSPMFTAVAVLTLALGTGANTAIFSLVDAVLLRPLPYPQADRLVTPRMVGTREGMGTRRLDSWSYPKFELLQRTTRTLESVSAFAGGRISLAGADSSELIDGEYVSSTYLPLLGIQAAHGRIFTEEEDRNAGAQPVTVIGYALWQQRFSGATDVLSQTIQLNQVALTIIGVLPKGFRGQSGEADVWIPMAMAPIVMNRPSRLTEPQAHWHQVIARVRDGVTLEAIRSDAQNISDALTRELPMSGVKISLDMQPLVEAKVDPAIRGAVLILFGAVGLVLLIACVNMAGLLLSRAAGRRREIAIRHAIGASRAEIVRQLLVESVVLAICGGLAGLLFAVWTIDILSSFRPAGTDGVWRNYSAVIRPDTVSFNGVAAVFHFAAAILAGILFGLVPAFQSSRPDFNEALKSMPGGATDRFARILRVNARTALIAGQLALAIVLVSSAGVMLKSFARLLTSVTGFTAERVLTARVSLPTRQYSGREAQFFEDLQQRMAGHPGVEGAAVTVAVPLGREAETTIVGIEQPAGRGGDAMKVTGVHSVSPKFFRVLGVPLKRGRLFDPRDGANAGHVAVVNEEFVRRYIAGEDPLGKRISMGLNGWGAANEMAEIVGVVGNVKYRAAENEVTPQVYLAVTQRAPSSMTLVVRTIGNPSAFGLEVRRAVAALDRHVPVHDIRTMEEVVGQATSRGKFTAMVLGVFALIAIVLAAIGMYGVAAHSSNARVREFALRMALGAERGTVLRMVLREAGLLATIAGIFGAPAAWAASRLLSTQVYQIEPQDPLLIAGVTALLILVALAATWIPTRRAVSVEPSVALRYE